MKTIEVVVGVIKKQNNILIAKRKSGEFDGSWEFPGGKIEEGETHKQALSKELKEELDIDVIVNDFVITIEYQYDSFNLIMHVYNVEIKSEKISLNVHSDLKWININNLDEVKWVPADILLIQYIK